jgi:hypothetical protein
VGRDCIAPGVVSGPFSKSIPCGLAAFVAATMRTMRQLSEQCASCGNQIATLETCVLPDGTQKRGAEVSFGESAEGGIRCTQCASEER